MSRADAIIWKKGGAPGYSFNGDEIVEWPDGVPRPTDEEVKTWEQEFAAHKAQQVARIERSQALRQSIGDPAEMFEKLITALDAKEKGDPAPWNALLANVKR